jgi:hypothetical protein
MGYGAWAKMVSFETRLSLELPNADHWFQSQLSVGGKAPFSSCKCILKWLVRVAVTCIVAIEQLYILILRCIAQKLAFIPNSQMVLFAFEVAF